MKKRMNAWGLFKPQEQDCPVYVNESRIDVKWTMDDWGGKSEGYVIRPVIVEYDSPLEDES